MTRTARSEVRFADHYEREDLDDGRVVIRLVELGIVVVGSSGADAEGAFDAAFLDLAASGEENAARVIAFLTEHSKPVGPVATYTPSDDVALLLPEAVSLTDLRGDPGRPLVVDFWASWCGPCKTMEIALASLARTNTGVEFRRVDVETNRDLAQHFNVQSVPTVVVIDGEQERCRLVGAMSEAKLRASLGL